jgi:hypothetical protein
MEHIGTHSGDATPLATVPDARARCAMDTILEATLVDLCPEDSRFLGLHGAVPREQVIFVHVEK